MDDWALATVADLEDRTRIRGAGAPPPAGAPASRRRRRGVGATATGAVNTAGSRDSRSERRSTGSVTAPPNRGMQVLAWTLVACAVLVIALGATATLVLLRANSTDIPVVSDIAAQTSGGSVEFSWGDPGLDPTDTYQISTGDGGTSVQSQSGFAVVAAAGDRVCITVTVSRDGKLGEPSGEKCVDVPG
jgi:hypothetical protein